MSMSCNRGRSAPGFVFSLLNMTDKIGLALAVGLTFPLLDVIEFNSQITNSAETLNWLLVIYVVPSCVMMLISGLMMWNYPIDKQRQEEMQAILASRNQA